MTASLIVSRRTAYGYFLDDAGDGILLHQNEAVGTLEVGDQVTVFLYLDAEDRLTATMHMPIVGYGEYGWLEVVAVSPRLGVFVHNGISKDLLVFVDDLPQRQEEWPRVGDHLLVTMKRDKNGRLIAKPATEEVMREISVPADKSMLNKWVEGTVYKVIGAGALLFTDEEHILFVHRDEMTEHLRLGQTVRCRVSFVREDGRLNGSMRGRKEQQYGEDADSLLRYLASRGGAMPYTDDTPADIIKQKFGISKAAFKRAMGKLLKERLVEQREGWTYLKREAAALHAEKDGLES
ncbi:DNA-binding protein [Brevibacillus sp. SYP-B805]|uniref:CvfB family protein n=1 Tax=Brevibacillus sp. SYP-B805 TaxID=1578199 RepID=UPI0013EC9BD8|nr:S1-like domain-containing RNA-binding protein [Brevibacillus sp. SYP-B805]NGQ96663.1 DNA-binding protein [Brevibacillus sp. SYP-B805]